MRTLRRRSLVVIRLYRVCVVSRPRARVSSCGQAGVSNGIVRSSGRVGIWLRKLEDLDSLAVSCISLQQDLVYIMKDRLTFQVFFSSYFVTYRYESSSGDPCPGCFAGLVFGHCSDVSWKQYIL